MIRLGGGCHHIAPYKICLSCKFVLHTKIAMSTLRNRRKEMGLTLVELAEKVGLTAGQLSRIERGGSPSLKTALALERVTGVRASDLADDPVAA